jgi:hypothetical protein
VHPGVNGVLHVMKTACSPLFAAALGAGMLAGSPLAQAPARAGTGSDAAKREAADLALFARKATLAKELGATHMIVTEGLPLATWEMDPNDPYPMWFVHHASLLNIFPPEDLRPYVDAKYSAEVQGVTGGVLQGAPGIARAANRSAKPVAKGLLRPQRGRAQDAPHVSRGHAELAEDLP